MSDSVIGLPAVAIGDVISGSMTTEITAACSTNIALRAITDANVTGGNVTVHRIA